MPFLACLMLLMTAWVGVAHAAEVGGCIETSRIETGQIETGHYDVVAHIDGDQVGADADADKAYPHQHGSCHAHHMNVSDSDTRPGIGGPVRSALAWFDGAALVGRDAETALRPPQA